MELIINGIKIDLTRRDKEKYVPGGMICRVAPWASSGCPLTMAICICPDGKILFRGWSWDNSANSFLHVCYDSLNIQPTKEMAETVAGLFSGRILVEGVKVAVGASVQDICPIDVKTEEKRIGKRIFLSARL